MKFSVLLNCNKIDTVDAKIMKNIHYSQSINALNIINIILLWPVIHYIHTYVKFLRIRVLLNFISDL